MTTQTKTKHTPGPWRVERGFIMAGEPVETPRGIATKTIARMQGTVLADYHANARLIAAAPELLLACECALEDFQSGKANLATYDRLFNVIAKARGEA